MAILCGVVRRQIGEGGDLSRNRSGLATTEWPILIDEAVI
jgi:hypothetical protein